MDVLLQRYWDQNNAYPTLTKDQMLESMGLLPPWFEQALLDIGKPIWDTLSELYGFGLYESDKGSIGDKQIYSYPGDNDLNPVVVYEYKDREIIFYPYAIVAIKEDAHSPYRITRMD